MEYSSKTPEWQRGIAEGRKLTYIENYAISIFDCSYKSTNTGNFWINYSQFAGKWNKSLGEEALWLSQKFCEVLSTVGGYAYSMQHNTCVNLFSGKKTTDWIDERLP